MTRADADETARRLARVYRAPFIVLAGLNPGTYDVVRYFGLGFGLDVVWPPKAEPCSRSVKP
jgi:hypothetical protein